MAGRRGLVHGSLVLLVLLVACTHRPPAAGLTPSASPSSSESGSASPSGSPDVSPSPSHSAPSVPRFIAVTSFSGGSIIGVRLINLSGRTVASYRGTGISSVTTSNTEVYFLIGLKEVRFLTPSGAGGRLA